MNKLLKILLIIVLSFGIIGCGNKKINNKNKEIETMQIIIDNKEYSMLLEDNETTKRLIELLPLELTMEELNGNEKYVYLEEHLPTNEVYEEQIKAGDVMLYTDNCLVIFYKTFKTTYPYTKIGHINNLEDLGKNNITIKIQGEIK